jgi:hypothetical protein
MSSKVDQRDCVCVDRLNRTICGASCARVGGRFSTGLECASSNWPPFTSVSRTTWRWWVSARWAATCCKRCTVLRSTSQMSAVPSSQTPSADISATARPCLREAYYEPSGCPPVRRTPGRRPYSAAVRCVAACRSRTDGQGSLLRDDGTACNLDLDTKISYILPELASSIS